MDKVYDLNEFNTESQCQILKLNEVSEYKNKQIKQRRFVIITESQFLIFDPLKDNQSQARLLDKKELSYLLAGMENDQDDSIIQFELSDDNFVHLEFISPSWSEIREKVKDTVSRLGKYYIIDQNDLKKPEANDSEKEEAYDLKKMDKIIDYNEKLIEEQGYSRLVGDELIALYQRAIEVSSISGSGNFEIYLTKMKNLIVRGEDKGTS